MMSTLALIVPTLIAASTSPAAGKAQVKYAPPPVWALPPPASAGGAANGDLAFRFVYSDQQIRVTPAGQERYAAWRMKLLKPEALQVGNLRVTWKPAAGAATIHYLRVIRDGKPADILKQQQFQVIQREAGLEQSVLDGDLTAMLQIAGLQVGDEVEFAATITERDPTLGDHAFGFAAFPSGGMPGVFRFRLSWPDNRSLTTRATRDLAAAVPVKSGGWASVGYEVTDPSGSIINDGAPARYNIRRLIEYSDFATWADVSRRFAPLFDTAATLGSASPLRAEAAKIAAKSNDPAARALAALRLVQDEVRYVYVGLDGGNYRPAATDETWGRRFGDCKAKTVMLLALLRYLGIPAEAVIVNPNGADGADARLPNPALFNHVLVRATIGSKPYWLDGTRAGDRWLDQIPSPAWRFALPLRDNGANLERVPPVAYTRPQTISFIDIDASEGFDKPAKVKAENVMREDEAFAVSRQLSGMPKAEADRALRSYWRQQADWIDADDVSWNYDERHSTLVVRLLGSGKPTWEGDSKDGRTLDIIGAGFFAPEQRRRPREQDQAAPWANEFPRFRCYATSIRLPVGGPNWEWDFFANPVSVRLGGVAYWRASGMKDGVVRTVMSTRTEQPEISAADARQVNDAIPSFNNKISRVYQVAAGSGKISPSRQFMPFGDAVDWAGEATPCSDRTPPSLTSTP